MMNMKFSIAIPAYKSQYLKEAIDSVLSQTYDNFELILLNDSSPYNIDAIIEPYLKDNRILYVKNEYNVGALNVVDNWNKCLELSKGDYFICMGDDDKLDSHCLEGYCEYINKYPTFDLFHVQTEMIDENSQFYSLQESRPEVESVYSMAWHRLTRKRDQYIGDFLFRIDKLREMGGFYKLPLAWGSDDITTYKCAMQAGIVNIPKVLFQYRVNRYTISNSGNCSDKLRAIKEEKEWYRNNLLTAEPQTALDEKYMILINRIFVQSFERKMISTLASDLQNKPWYHLFKLAAVCRKHNISFKIAMVSMILGIYRKI